MNVLKKIIFREKYSSDTYIKFLRKKGVKIGDGTTIYSPRHVFIDIQRPWLLEIGEDVQITNGVTIITHGYDWSVLKRAYGDIIGSSSKVKIGNNVFIGMNTTILKGVKVGDNVIIGAGSLVNKDIPNNMVVAGNPAKIICSLDEYYKKRKCIYKEEAIETAFEYYKRYKKIPEKKLMYEFFWMWEDEKSFKNTEKYMETMKLVGNYNESLEKLSVHKKDYENYNEFIKYIVNKEYKDR